MGALFKVRSVVSGSVAHDESAHGAKDELPESFWVANAMGPGGAAALGFVIDFTAAMNSQQEPHDMGGEGVALIESTEKSERWYEKVEDSLHMHVETLSPAAFLDGARGFLQAVGLVGLTQISVDEEPVRAGEATARMSLNDAADACSERLAQKGDSVRTIEITSHGRNAEFTMLVDFSYRRRHRPMEPPIELEVQAMASELGPKEGEPFADYRARMNALDSDPRRRDATYSRVKAEKKALYSDYAHHLSQAFPGVNLNFYERVPVGET